MRYFIELSYFGKAYHGWQRQPNASSVQQTLDEAISTLLRTTISVIGAGRTDAGVHAKQLFAHFDIEGKIDVLDLTRRLNAFLPKDIAVSQVFKVNDDAHARFDATSRSYEYWLVSQKNPFYNENAHFVHEPLNFEAMNNAAAMLLKHKNFECFSKSNTDVKTFLCEVSEAVWTIDDEKAVFHITADRFLRNMVRAVVGTLLEIGLNRKSAHWIEEVIASKNRSEAGVSVPAKGLYLTRIVYPDSIYS